MRATISEPAAQHFLQNYSGSPVPGETRRAVLAGWLYNGVTFLTGRR